MGGPIDVTALARSVSGSGWSLRTRGWLPMWSDASPEEAARAVAAGDRLEATRGDWHVPLPGVADLKSFDAYARGCFDEMDDPRLFRALTRAEGVFRTGPGSGSDSAQHLVHPFEVYTSMLAPAAAARDLRFVVDGLSLSIGTPLEMLAISFALQGLAWGKMDAGVAQEALDQVRATPPASREDLVRLMEAGAPAREAGAEVASLTSITGALPGALAIWRAAAREGRGEVPALLQALGSRVAQDGPAAASLVEACRGEVAPVLRFFSEVSQDGEALHLPVARAALRLGGPVSDEEGARRWVDTYRMLQGGGLSPQAVANVEQLAMAASGAIGDGEWTYQPCQGTWEAKLATCGDPTESRLEFLPIAVEGWHQPRLEWTADYHLSEDSCASSMEVDVERSPGEWSYTDVQYSDATRSRCSVELPVHDGQPARVRLRLLNSEPCDSITSDDYHYHLQDLKLTGVDANGQALVDQDLGRAFRDALLKLVTVEGVDGSLRDQVLSGLALSNPNKATDLVMSLSTRLQEQEARDVVDLLEQELKGMVFGEVRPAPPAGGTIEKTDDTVKIAGIVLPRRVD